MDMIKKTNKGINGSTLKIIAIVTMLIDHIGATIVQGELYNLPLDYETMKIIFNIGVAMRIIGRVAFPIFCFLLVEGFLHTKSVKKYAIRLFLFALISEIPFDLALCKNIFELEHQNVFFTLFIGILVMYGIDFFRKCFADKKIACTILVFLVIVVGMIIAEIINCDYAALGILIIVILYFFNSQRALGAMFACFILAIYCVNPAISMYKQLVEQGYNNDLYAVVFYMVSSVLELFACIAFIPIHFYNGERGLSLKYFFYAFYPVHLLLLGIIVNFII